MRRKQRRRRKFSPSGARAFASGREAWHEASSSAGHRVPALPADRCVVVTAAFPVYRQVGRRPRRVYVDDAAPSELLSSTVSAEPAEVLSGKIPWQDRIGRDDQTGLFYFVRAGFPGHLEQLLDENPVEQMKAAFDYIIIDSAPVMRVADATLFARFVDMVVLVVAAKRTSRRTVTEALRRLSIAAKPLGIVLTNTKEYPSDQDIYTGYGPRGRGTYARVR